MPEDNIEVQSVSISKIKFGKRLCTRRDVEGLKQSIAEVGLLQFPSVDDQLVLICGARRVLACKELGWEMITVRVYYQPSELLKIQIELAENEQRTDLTAHERSLSISNALDRVKVILANAAKIQFGVGRPANDVASEEQLAEAIKTPRSTVRLALRHVEAVRMYPRLKDLSQRKALAEADKLSGRTKPKETRQRKQTESKPVDVAPAVSVPAVVSTDAIDLSSPVGQAIDQFAEVLAKLARLRQKVCGALMWTLDQDDPMDVETIERGIDELIQQRDDAISVSTEVQAELEAARATTGKAFTATTGSRLAEKPAGQWPQFQAGDLCENGRKGKICATTLNPRNHHPACDRF